jgi:branched-chain amino acid transport system substrate-binding protein
MSFRLKPLALAAALIASAGMAAADDLKIALIYGLTGPLQAYAKQTETGLKLGFEYATKGTMTVDGRKIVIVAKDDQGKPDLAKRSRRSRIRLPATSGNRYIFRTARNSTQDAISNALAIGKPGVHIATLAQDYAFGRDGVAAFKQALAKTGATLEAEEYAPVNTTDFTAPAQRLFDALKDQPGRKIIWVVWAGAVNPLDKLADSRPWPLWD